MRPEIIDYLMNKNSGTAPSATPQGGINADQRAQLYAELIKRQNGMGNTIGNTLAGVGEAIARGYGRDSGANQLDKTIGLQQQGIQTGMGLIDKQISDQSAQNENNPMSSASKLAQEAYGPIFSKIGIPPEQLTKMPASKIQMIAELGMKNADIDAQKELKQATLDLQSMIGNANIANQKAQRIQEEKKAKAEAATKLLGTDKKPTLLNPFSWGGGLPKEQRKAAEGVLMEQIGAGYIQTATNPKTGERMGTKDGKNWEPIE